MPLNSKEFEIDCSTISEKIEAYIKEYVKNSGTKGLVVGLSGGIDSAVTAALAVRALGNDHVLGLILPNEKLNQHYEDDARTLAKQLGIEVKKISIKDFEIAFKANIDEEMLENKLVLGNAMARFRMVLLYAYSNHLNNLVVGTSNKTEILVGYITKYGDGGVDFEPCGSLYKTQIRALAKYLDIPNSIIEKPPSAGLWDGQTDEGELGITYELLDLVLLGMEKGLSNEAIAKELDIKQDLVKKVEKMVRNSDHKRNMPPVCNLD